MLTVTRWFAEVGALVELEKLNRLHFQPRGFPKTKRLFYLFYHIKTLGITRRTNYKLSFLQIVVSNNLKANVPQKVGSASTQPGSFGWRERWEETREPRLGFVKSQHCFQIDRQIIINYINYRSENNNFDYCL